MRILGDFRADLDNQPQNNLKGLNNGDYMLRNRLEIKLIKPEYLIKI